MKTKKEAIVLTVLTVFLIFLLHIHTAISQTPEDDLYKIPDVTIQGKSAYKITETIKVSYTIIPHVSENIVYSFFVTCPEEIKGIATSEPLQLSAGIAQKKSFDIMLEKAANPQNCAFDFSIEEPYNFGVVENFELIIDESSVNLGNKESKIQIFHIIKSNYHIILPFIGVIIFVIGSLLFYFHFFKNRARIETQKIPTDLEKYIQKELKKGFSKNKIKAACIKVGWKETDIDRILKNC